MRLLLRYFLRGLIITIPAAVTIYLFRAIFVWIDRLIAAPFPGAGFLLTIGLIILVGVLASNLLIRKLLDLTEALFIRAPIVKLVYSSVKDLLEAFVGEKKRFNHPVIADLDATGHIRALGFITREEVGFLDLPGHCAVYFPQSYNFAGNVLILPRASVRATTMESSEAMKFIVSGGISKITGVE